MSRSKEQSLSTTGLAGRPFVHPVFDVMLIGGGLSLVVVVFVFLNPNTVHFVSDASLPYFVLLSNSAYFTASIVRL